VSFRVAQEFQVAGRSPCEEVEYRSRAFALACGRIVFRRHGTQIRALAFGMEFQPPKYKPLLPAQCAVCGAACLCLPARRHDSDILQEITFHARIKDQASQWVLFGYRQSYGGQGRSVCLCVDCYFSHVDRRARSCPAFTQITPAEIADKAALMSKGLHPLPAGETEKERCLRLIVIGQSREKFHGKSSLKDLIAEDLGLEPAELFPEVVEPAYNSIKESIIFQVLRHRSAEWMRRTLVSWPALLAYLFIAVIAALAIYRSRT